MTRYRITVRDVNNTSTTYTAIGRRDALLDAAYDNGALGVTIIEEKRA